MALNILKSYKLFTLVLFLLVLNNPLQAQMLQATEENKQAAAAEIPEDSLGRRTPRGTVNGFLSAVADQNYIRASRYLKLRRSQQKEREQERIVKILQGLLDKGGNLMPTAWISDETTGRIDDGLNANVDLVGTVTINGEAVNLLVENYEREGAPPVWVFNAETVAKISPLSIEDALLVDRILPQVLKEKLLAGVPLGHWIAVIVLIAVAYMVAWGIIALIFMLIRLFWAKARVEPTRGVISAFGLPFRIYLTVWLFIVLSQQVGISIIIRQRFSSITVTIGIIAILILLWRLADYISNYTKNRMSRRGRISAISIILFIRRTIKVALIVLGCIAILSAVGVNVTTWLAALGIGGIALALGAQKTVENFVGGVSLVVDQPLRVGDYCKIGDVTGTVEQIGMRSTRLRTGERTVVTIPNGDLSASRIENFAHRDRFLFDPVFELRLDTTPDQIRFLLVELRSILYSHPQVNPDPAKIRFTGITTTSVKLEFWAYIEAPDFDTFQEIQEDILLRMMDVVAKSGTSFAMPSQNIFIARDKGIPEEKITETAEQIKKWREGDELQIPKFDPEHIKKIKNSIDYPAEGSVAAKRIRDAKKDADK
jgi:MscS family membrane protein